MQQGLLGRISRTSIMEYHAFGIISEGRRSGCHYMICGVQGDFTKDLVANPPRTVWTRELKFGTFPFCVCLSCVVWYPVPGRSASAATLPAWRDPVSGSRPCLPDWEVGGVLLGWGDEGFETTVELTCIFLL